MGGHHSPLYNGKQCLKKYLQLYISVVTAEILATVTTHVILLMFNIRTARLSATAFLWRFFA